MLPEMQYIPFWYDLFTDTIPAFTLLAIVIFAISIFFTLYTKLNKKYDDEKRNNNYKNANKYIIVALALIVIPRLLFWILNARRGDGEFETTGLLGTIIDIIMVVILFVSLVRFVANFTLLVRCKKRNNIDENEKEILKKNYKKKMIYCVLAFFLACFWLILRCWPMGPIKTGEAGPFDF